MADPTMCELRLLAPQDVVEELCDWLDEAGALSVSVEDADALTDRERPLFGEPGMPVERAAWAHSRIAALFTSRDQAMIAQAALANSEFAPHVQAVGLHEVPDTDWVRQTQAQFEPVPITDEFWIVPTWHEVPAVARVVLRVDPGLAFGTGTHPTTRMCLRWIARQTPQQLGRTLDYGCGSGILAMAAAKHGAHPVEGVDIDPDAVETSRRNALDNAVQITTGLPDMAHGEYDTVLANILASPLKVLAPLLCALVRPGGRLVMAGILARQAEELRVAYAPWLALEILDEQDGWILMSARRVM